LIKKLREVEVYNHKETISTNQLAISLDIDIAEKHQQNHSEKIIAHDIVHN